MTEQFILCKRYKSYAGLSQTAEGWGAGGFSELGPRVFRLKDNATGASGVGQTGILGPSLHSPNQNFTQRNDVIFFNGKIYTWFNNNVWQYDPTSEADPVPTYDTWNVAFSPTTSTNPHLGLYGVHVSGQASLATCAFESTSSARMVVYNPWTGFVDRGNTATYGGGVLAEGVHTEIEFNNKIYWVNSGGSDVNIFNPEKLAISVLSMPSNFTFPMDLCPFEGKMYMLTNTTDSGCVVARVDEVEGVTAAAFIDTTNPSGGSVLANQDAYSRNSAFVTTVSGHFTGTNPDDRWPSGDPGDGIKTPHMVLYVNANGVEPPAAGYATYCATNEGTRFNHDITVAVTRFSIHSFPVGVIYNPPSEQGQGNTHQSFVDDFSVLASSPGGDEQMYNQIRMWQMDNAGARAIYWPHSEDGSRRWNMDYRGPKQNNVFIDSGPDVLPTGNTTHALSFPKHYCGGHRYQAVGQMDIIVSGVEQGLDNDNMRIHFQIKNNATAHNGTPASVRVMYAEFNGAAMKGTGVLENPSHGSIFDSTRMDIPAIDSGTIYSVEWNNKASSFIDTEWLQFGLYIST